ncbi:unnamed protein product [Mycena citricolor]|uniref:3-hydroxyisobutyryl-CoA hydrolase n=1 Tax=Mycena citricolor TaxID=2018698 RepID=A0AAD2GW79_9AGAR|nr:unnamed protein product [Mycena citricolor]
MLRASTRLMTRTSTALNRTRALAKHMSGVSGSSKDIEPLVRFETTQGLRTYVLNRPSKLNALNEEMINLLRPKIEEWDAAELCNVIVGTGKGRGFCAGGDVETVVKFAAEDGTRDKAVEFFKREFDLDLFLASIRKPYVAILDGPTMGGGVGLSAPAPFRVATENTVFAMPETKIGYCPDVGSSYFMSRLDGEIGTYLALTGATLQGRAVFEHGFATHFIPARRLPLLLDRLSNVEEQDHTTIDRTLEELSSEREDSDPPAPLVSSVRIALDFAFRHDRVERILADLEQLSSDSIPAVSHWATQTLQQLRERSPTSLKVALRAIRLGKTQTLTEAFNMELKIATAYCSGASSDFATGVTELLVNKSKEPRQWTPNNLEDVTDEIVDRFFSPHSKYLAKAPTVGHTSFDNRGTNERTLRFGLPTELEISRVITGEDPDSGDMGYTLDDLIQYFHETKDGKMGVEKKIRDVVSRKTTLVDNNDGNYVWLRWNP